MSFSVLSLQVNFSFLLSIFMTFYWIYDLILLNTAYFWYIYYHFFFQMITCLHFLSVLAGNLFCFHLIHVNQPLCKSMLVCCPTFFWRFSIHFLHKKSKVFPCFGPYLAYINCFLSLLHIRSFFCLFWQIALFWASHFYPCAVWCLRLNFLFWPVLISLYTQIIYRLIKKSLSRGLFVWLNLKTLSQTCDV